MQHDSQDARLETGTTFEQHSVVTAARTVAFWARSRSAADASSSASNCTLDCSFDIVGGILPRSLQTQARNVKTRHSDDEESTGTASGICGTYLRPQTLASFSKSKIAFASASTAVESAPSLVDACLFLIAVMYAPRFARILERRLAAVREREKDSGQPRTLCRNSPTTTHTYKHTPFQIAFKVHPVRGAWQR
jgi:hypothetical protein